jgi:hypothetical protein
MQGPDAQSPHPSELRAWQRFVTENLEFRLGVAIGAVVARAWTAGANDPLAVPTLETWRATTGLPWFGFWARELLRWGTLDPFVAFALAQGLARTRGEAAQRRIEYEAWLNEGYIDLEPEDMIDPQLFLKWQLSLQQPNVAERGPNGAENAVLTGTDGQLERYGVVPVQHGDTIHWIDAAGYELATSGNEHGFFSSNANRNDFDLGIQQHGALVRRVFTAQN